MKKIMHIISDLNGGGAEHMLYKLLKYSDRKKYYHEVISLIDDGVYGKKIKAEGIRVHCLNLTFNNIISSLVKCRAICKEFDLIDTWLYHADTVGFIVAKILLHKKLIWNIRHNNLEKGENKPLTLKIVKINAILSNFVDCITYNSGKARESHCTVGYKDSPSVVIPNGFELDKFKFDHENRIKVRQELEIDMHTTVLITVGRWDIQKDYHTLIKALGELRKHNKVFFMVMCGSGLDYKNDDLVKLIEEEGLNGNVKLLGRRENIPELLSAADIYISSSKGESFSNSIGEAMACELPCIVTDVGDSRYIVGDAGFVVEKENPIELSNAIYKLLNDRSIDEYKIRARSRISEKFTISEVVKKFELLYDTYI